MGTKWVRFKQREEQIEDDNAISAGQRKLRKQSIGAMGRLQMALSAEGGDLFAHSNSAPNSRCQHATILSLLPKFEAFNWAADILPRYTTTELAIW